MGEGLHPIIRTSQNACIQNSRNGGREGKGGG